MASPESDAGTNARADARTDALGTLEVRQVSKTFPGVKALKSVSLSVAQGEIRGLVGENGAGKSTLIKVITGALAPDEGEVFINGQKLDRAAPGRAEQLGLAVIHQEKEIAPDVSVAENALLGRLPANLAGLINWRQINRRAADLIARLGLTTDVRRSAGSLSVAEQQEVTIARALGGGQRILIMDEPTSSLGASEVARLLELVRTLRDAGTTVIYISHHLEELFAIADNITVMRDGAVVGTHPTQQLNKDQLVSLMFGRQAQSALPRRSKDEGESKPVLEVRDVYWGRALRGVSLDLHEGEILCVTGGIGSGQLELAETVAGARRPEWGEVRVEGRAVKSRADAVRRGVAFVPEDRKTEGVMLDLDITENVDLVRMNRQSSPFVSPRRRRRLAAQSIEEVRGKYADLSMTAGQLSGGNQQKLLLARWLAVGARIFAFSEPTAGIDVSAKVEIYQIINRLAREGTSFLLFSSDFEEIQLMADRVVVLSKGCVVDEVPREEISEERLFGYQTKDLAPS